MWYNKFALFEVNLNWDFLLFKSKSILRSSLNKQNRIQLCVLVFPIPHDTIIELWPGFLTGLCLNLLWYFTDWSWFRIWVLFVFIHFMIVTYFSRCISDISSYTPVMLYPILRQLVFTPFIVIQLQIFYVFIHSQCVLFSFFFIFKIFNLSPQCQLLALWGIRYSRIFVKLLITRKELFEKALNI